MEGAAITKVAGGVKRKSVDGRAPAANLAAAMTGQAPKPPAKSPSQVQRDQRLAKALRDNLRRRKAAPPAAAPSGPDTPKAD